MASDRRIQLKTILSVSYTAGKKCTLHCQCKLSDTSHVTASCRVSHCRKIINHKMHQVQLYKGYVLSCIPISQTCCRQHGAPAMKQLRNPKCNANAKDGASDAYDVVFRQTAE